MLAEAPCAGVDLPRVKHKEMEALSVEECRQFLSVAEESESYALFALALTAGWKRFAAAAIAIPPTHKSAMSQCLLRREQRVFQFSYR
jgi:hypothetical protein